MGLSNDFVWCANCYNIYLRRQKKLISEFVVDLMSDVSCLELAKKWRKKQK